MPRNEYEISLDVLNQLRVSELNPDAAGGVEYQLDQLYGVANGVFMALAHNAQDSTINGFTNLLRKVRQDE